MDLWGGHESYASELYVAEPKEVTHAEYVQRVNDAASRVGVMHNVHIFDCLREGVKDATYRVRGMHASRSYLRMSR